MHFDLQQAQTEKKQQPLVPFFYSKNKYKPTVENRTECLKQEKKKRRNKSVILDDEKESWSLA